MRMSLVEDPSTHDLIALKAFWDPIDEDSFLKVAESVICRSHPCVVRAVGCYCGRHLTVGTTSVAKGSLQSCSFDETGKVIIACAMVLG
jgi:hypothetical protein